MRETWKRFSKPILFAILLVPLMITSVLINTSSPIPDSLAARYYINVYFSDPDLRLKYLAVNSDFRVQLLPVL